MHTVYSLVVVDGRVYVGATSGDPTAGGFIWTYE